jgi:hypothetical protein
MERDISRYRWTGRLETSARFADWAVQLENRFLSDAFILSNNDLSFRDENRLSWAVGRSFSQTWSFESFGRAGWYSLSRVFSQEAYAGARYRFGSTAWIEPRIGFAIDRRPGVAEPGVEAPLRSDPGPAYGLGFQSTAPPSKPYKLNVLGYASWQAITPRRARDLRLRVSGEHRIRNTTVRGRLLGASFRRDAYEPVSFLNRDTEQTESVEATWSDTLQFVGNLESEVGRGLKVTGRLDVASYARRVRTLNAPGDAIFYDTNFDRRSFEADLGLAHEGRNAGFYLGLIGGIDREERFLDNAEDLPSGQAAQKTNILRQADFDRGHFAIRGRSRLMLSELLGVRFEGSANILRHDTPIVNPDDRDELFYDARLGIQLHLSRYLTADVSLYGSRYETVYIKATRSAENNVQQALRLRPSILFTPAKGTEIRVTSEVRATYTVHRFTLPGRVSRDQSARELRYEVDLTQDLPGPLVLYGSGSYSDLRLGRYLDSEFSEIPFDTLRTWGGVLAVGSSGTIRARVGVRLLSRSDFSQSTTVRYDRVGADGGPVLDETGSPLQSSVTRPGKERIRQLGPTCSILWPMWGGSAIRLDGWLVIQSITYVLYGDLPEGSEGIIRAAASKGRRTVIPNLTLTATWRI